MRNRSLTVLWLIMFASQAAGLTHALHLALEHHGGHTGCQHETGGPLAHAHDGSDAGLPSLGKPTPPGHDPAHCSICQAMAAAKPLHGPRTDAITKTQPVWVPIAVVSQRPLSSTHISTLGPRAPPAYQLSTAV